jgi:hypothetical protein
MKIPSNILEAVPQTMSLVMLTIIFKALSKAWGLEQGPTFKCIWAHKHTHTHIYICIYMYMYWNLRAALRAASILSGIDRMICRFRRTEMVEVSITQIRLLV